MAIRISLDPPRYSGNVLKKVKRAFCRQRTAIIILLLCLIYILSIYEQLSIDTRNGTERPLLELQVNPGRNPTELQVNGKDFRTRLKEWLAFSSLTGASSNNFTQKMDRNIIDSSVGTCRNTVQGQKYIADDRGFLCKRENVRPNGCCSTMFRFQCQTCNSNFCCDLFESCVSCCMKPDYQSLLIQYLKKAKDLLSLVVKDQFETCLARCRTSSLSVVHENTYINPNYKYCFNQDADSPIAGPLLPNPPIVQNPPLNLDKPRIVEDEHLILHDERQEANGKPFIK